MKRPLPLILLLLLLCLPCWAQITFVDDDANRITLDAPASRIISLYSAHTENLYALGAGDCLIGAHSTSTYPPQAAFLPRYDYNADPEYIIAAQPDLVLIRPFISRRAPQFVQALKKAGIPVVSLYPQNLADFDDYIEKLALLVGRESEAEAALSAFHGHLSSITRKTQGFSPKTRVFFESTENEYRTTTADSMAGQAIAMAGGDNLAADAGPITPGSSIAAFGAERILALADKIDAYVSQRGAMNAGGNEHAITIRPGFSTIKAVAEGRIYLISEKLISSPTFRYTKGVYQLARFFYPQEMDDLSAYLRDDKATRRDFAHIVLRARHLPYYVPSSSKYYDGSERGHLYGLFEDVPWTDADFDVIEACVQAGYIGYEGDHYLPDAPVSREDLARTVFLSGDFAVQEDHTPIADLDLCQKPRIVQTLVDNGVFALDENGAFNPRRPVTCREIVAAMGQ